MAAKPSGLEDLKQDEFERQKQGLASILAEATELLGGLR